MCIVVWEVEYVVVVVIGVVGVLEFDVVGLYEVFEEFGW